MLVVNYCFCLLFDKSFQTFPKDSDMFVKSMSHCLGSSCRRFLPYVSVGMNCFQNISYFQYRMTSTHVNINRIYRSTAFPAFSSKGIKTASRCDVDEFSTSDICKLINSIDISSDDVGMIKLRYCIENLSISHITF